MHDAPDFFQIGVRGAECVLQIILAAQEEAYSARSSAVRWRWSWVWMLNMGRQGVAEETSHVITGARHCE